MPELEPDLETIIWQVTNKCNLSCDYCSTNSTPDGAFGPEREQWQHVAELLHEMDPVRIALTGGEVFTRPDLDDIIASVPKAPLLSIDTNGILLKDQWSEAFERVNHVSISVDGPRVIHDGQRERYDRVMDNIRWAIEHGIEVRSTITLTEESIEYLEETVKMLAEMGVSGVGFNRVAPVGRNTDGEYQLSSEDHIRTIHEAEELAKELGLIVDSGGWYGAYFEEADRQGSPSCFCGVYRATIRYDGAILPCHMLTYDSYYAEIGKYYDIPTMYEYNSMEAIYGTELFQDFKKATTEIIPEGCGECPHVEYCDHGCRAESWFKGHGIDGYNVLCSIGRENASVGRDPASTD